VPVPPLPLDTAVEFGTRYQDISRRVPDTTKASDVLGWQCEVPLREGLARTVDWARSNRWWLDPGADERPAQEPEGSR
jgi:nucleoside-diphosphate-sugar epimerase